MSTIVTKSRIKSIDGLIKRIIIKRANDADLTFAKDYGDKPYTLMNVDWIGYYDTLEDVCKTLGIEDIYQIIKEYCEVELDDK